jgi:hypothetical protein
MTFTDAAPFVPALLYLALVSGLLRAGSRVPVAVHGVAAAVGVLTHGALVGALSAAVSVAVAFVALLVLVYAAQGLLSAVGVFTTVTSLAVVPAGGWLGIGAGLIVATVVGIIQTIRVAGVSRVLHLTGATALAMGVTPGGFVRPNPDLLPQPEDTALIVKDERDAARMRLVLPPYLLLGVAGAATLAVVL